MDGGWWHRTIQFLHKCDVVVSPTYTDTIDLLAGLFKRLGNLVKRLADLVNMLCVD